MLSDKRTHQLRALAIELLERQAKGLVIPGKFREHAASELAYGFLMLSRGVKQVEALAPCDEPDLFNELLRAIADAIDDFLCVAKADYLEDLSPGVREDVEIATTGPHARRATQEPAQRLTHGGGDAKALRAYLLDAIATVILKSDVPNVNDFADAISLATGILDVRTEAEVDADVDRICRDYHNKLKQKDQSQ